MTDQPAPAQPGDPRAGHEPRERIFLVVVDETEEMKNALHFASPSRPPYGRARRPVLALEPPGIPALARGGAGDAGRGAPARRADPAGPGRQGQAAHGQDPGAVSARGTAAPALTALIDEELPDFALVLEWPARREGPGPPGQPSDQPGATVDRLPVTPVLGQLQRRTKSTRRREAARAAHGVHRIRDGFSPSGHLTVGSRPLILQKKLAWLDDRVWPGQWHRLEGTGP